VKVLTVGSFFLHLVPATTLFTVSQTGGFGECTTHSKPSLYNIDWLTTYNYLIYLSIYQ